MAVSIRFSNFVGAFVRETGVRHGILLTMITTYGLRQNSHSGCVDDMVTMDHLFEKLAL